MGNAQRWARITSRTSPSSSPLLVQRSFFFAAKRFALRSFLSFPQRMHHSSPHASHRHAVARSAASRPATAWCQQLQRALGEGWESSLLGELWRAARGLVEPAHPKLTSSFNHTSIPGSMLKVTHAEFFGVLGFGATSASARSIRHCLAPTGESRGSRSHRHRPLHTSSRACLVSPLRHPT